VCERLIRRADAGNPQVRICGSPDGRPSGPPATSDAPACPKVAVLYLCRAAPSSLFLGISQQCQSCCALSSSFRCLPSVCRPMPGRLRADCLLAQRCRPPWVTSHSSLRSEGQRWSSNPRFAKRDRRRCRSRASPSGEWRFRPVGSRPCRANFRTSMVQSASRRHRRPLRRQLSQIEMSGWLRRRAVRSGTQKPCRTSRAPWVCYPELLITQQRPASCGRQRMAGQHQAQFRWMPRRLAPFLGPTALVTKSWMSRRMSPC